MKRYITIHNVRDLGMVGRMTFTIHIYCWVSFERIC